MEIAVAIFVGCNRSFEVAGVGQAVGADGAKLGQTESEAIVLADVTASMLAAKFNAELDAARDDADFAGRDFEDAEFGVKADDAGLRNNEHFTIGIGEKTVAHGGVGGVEMDGDSGLHGRVAVAAESDDAFEEIGWLLGKRERVPAKLIGRCGHFVERAAAQEAHSRLLERAMSDRRAYAIRPGAAIGGARRGERRAAELLSIKAQRMVLGRVLAEGQRAGDSFGDELVGEAGLITNVFCHGDTSLFGNLPSGAKAPVFMQLSRHD